MAYSDTDISVRLSYLRCSIAEQGLNVSRKKKYGLAIECDTKKLQLLIVYEGIICGYITTSSNNYITEAKLDHIFNMITRITQVCYAPLGYSYFENTPVSVESAFLWNDSSAMKWNDNTSILLNS